MANIYPFRAVRPTRDKVSLVSSRSYGDYSAAELAAQITYNPLSFLHILNPAYSDPQRTTTEERFLRVRSKYEEFKEERILIKDEKPAVYIHKIATPSHVFTGIIVATSVEDYKNDLIKRHEDTIDYRVDWLKDYIKFAGFNSEPVLMTYPDNDDIQRWMDEKMSHQPEFEFSTTKNDIHFLWKIDDEKEVQRLQEYFAGIGNLYIADGHHRSASAEKLSDEAGGADEAKNHFMSFLIADSNVKIYEFNRLIRSMRGITKKQFLERLEEDFTISHEGSRLYHPQQKHEFALYMDAEFYSLKLRPEKQQFKSVVEALDTQILYDRILHPLLGIKNLRSDDRIEYLPGIRPVSRLTSCVDDGGFVMAFILYPTDIDEIKAVADARLTMPPKSTYIEPKFRSGLVVYEV